MEAHGFEVVRAQAPDPNHLLARERARLDVEGFADEAVLLFLGRAVVTEYRRVDKSDGIRSRLGRGGLGEGPLKGG